MTTNPGAPTPPRDWSGPPCPATEAVAAVLLPDATYSMYRLLDAMRALPQFGDPDRQAFGEFTPESAVIGDRQIWTYVQAREVIDHAFGPEGHDNLKHIVATFRTVEVPSLNDVFFLRCAILLRAGWTQEDDWLWWTVGPDRLGIELAAAWVGSWDLESLNMCVAAHLRRDELVSILDSGQRPDPEAIRTLVAMLPSRDGWNRTY